MKKTLLGVLLLFMGLGLIHLLIYPMNQDLHRALLLQKKEMTPVVELKLLRSELESTQRQELEKYKWIDQRKEYAEIPIERAFDYYLHHP